MFSGVSGQEKQKSGTESCVAASTRLWNVVVSVHTTRHHEFCKITIAADVTSSIQYQRIVNLDCLGFICAAEVYICCRRRFLEARRPTAHQVPVPQLCLPMMETTHYPRYKISLLSHTHSGPQETFFTLLKSPSFRCILPCTKTGTSVLIPLDGRFAFYCCITSRNIN